MELSKATGALLRLVALLPNLFFRQLSVCIVLLCLEQRSEQLECLELGRILTPLAGVLSENAVWGKKKANLLPGRAQTCVTFSLACS